MKCYLWKKLTLVTTIFTMLWSRGKKMIIYKVGVLFKTVKKIKKITSPKRWHFSVHDAGHPPR
jgi:hypothetical protein